MRTKGRAHPDGHRPSEGTAPKRLTATRNLHPGVNGFPRSGTPHDGGHPEGTRHPKGHRQASGAERVGEIQRLRLVAAMVDVAAERGVANVTVAHVVERAGVSRRTFYEIFEDCEDCLLAALADALCSVSEHVLAAYREEGRWAERIRRSLVALLELLEADPVTGHLLIVGSLGGGTRALERRGIVLTQIIAAVDEGRKESRAGAQQPPLTAEGVVGGVLSILHARLLVSALSASPRSPMVRGPGMSIPSTPPSHEGDSLLGLAGPLMAMIVLPYLGAAAARRELERPVPERHTPGPRPMGDPLRDVGLRLTYRTVRVLISVADSPGASNREIGEAAGIGDQGQISKLLSRLQRLGLVQNTGLGPGTGAPNVWTLTERGQAIHTAIATQAVAAP
jgi:AcrR family transcriptional regulator